MTHPNCILHYCLSNLWQAEHLIKLSTNGNSWHQHSAIIKVLSFYKTDWLKDSDFEFLVKLRQWFLLTIRCQMAWALDTNLILWNTKLYNPKCVVLRPGLRSGGWIYEGYLLTKSRYWSITNEAVTVPELFFPAPRWSMQCRIKEKSLPTTQSGWKDFWKSIPIFYIFLGR